MNPLENAATDRQSTKSTQARRARAARNRYLPKSHGQATPAPYGKEKFVRSGRYGASLMRGGFSRSILKGMGQAPPAKKGGEPVLVRLPRGSQRDYSLDGRRVGELRDLASRRGLKGLYTAKKAALIKAIEKDRF